MGEPEPGKVSHENPFVTEEWAEHISATLSEACNASIVAIRVNVSAVRGFLISVICGMCPERTESQMRAVAWEIAHHLFHIVADGLMVYEPDENQTTGFDAHGRVIENPDERQKFALAAQYTFVDNAVKDDLPAAIRCLHAVEKEVGDDPEVDQTTAIAAYFLGSILTSAVLNMAHTPKIPG